MAHEEFIAKLIEFEPEDECPIHVAAAILKPDMRGKSRIASGRGISAAEARQRCIAEAAERHAAVFNIHHGLTYASLDELGMSAVDPHRLILLSEEQYASIAKWNGAVDPDHHLPARFNPKTTIGWVKAAGENSKGAIHVPAAHVYLGYPNALDEGFPVPDSSGLAAGESVRSARERAVLELIERDALSIWWYGRVRRPELRIEAHEIPWLAAFADWIDRTDRRFWILDLSHDLGIPVAVAVSCDDHGGNLSFGFAAARSHQEAAASALGELVQFDLTRKLQGSNALPPLSFLRWCGTASIADNAFLRPDPDMPVSHFAAEADPLAAVSRAGLQALFIDFPRQSAHVVRALVPGLRPIWPRFAPGRLYDVPFELDWIERKLTESELNPVPILY